MAQKKPKDSAYISSLILSEVAQQGVVGPVVAPNPKS